MRIKRLIPLVCIYVAVAVMPLTAAASMSPYGCTYGYGEATYYGYGQATYYGYSQSTYYGYSQSTYYGYSQSTYYGYSQSTYYAQPSYQTTFSNNASALVNFNVTGAVSKGSGTFVIDHPLDPKNKLLYHSFVESPDVKNVYDGVVALGSDGTAIVALPAYFDALNKDIRYQLKPIGAPMRNLYVKTEERNNRFEIAGGVPGGKVSWQVTGTRHDPYIVANPIIPEVQKGPKQLVDRGEYLFPQGYLWTAFNYALPGAWEPDTRS